MPKPFAAILFDLDGTLLDSAHGLHACLSKLCLRYQKPIVRLIQVQRHFNEGALGLIRLAFGGGLSATEENDLRQQLLDEYAALQDHEPAHFFPGTLSLLHTLRTQNNVLGIVTNKYARFTIPILKNLELLEHLQVVICGDQVQEAKPAAEPLLKACAELNVDPTQCCYVGDSKQDMLSAQAAGMPGFLACWGYWPRLHYSIENWPYTEVFYTPEDFLKNIV